MSELGTLLARAREARGLTLEDAERDTRISRRYLQALESEQFEAIPAPVYARGFLRSYSQYLGLDPQEMLALFPTDDEVVEDSYGRDPARPASPDNPISVIGAARPTWKRAQPPRARQQQPPRARVRREAPAAAPSDEPVIGGPPRVVAGRARRPDVLDEPPDPLPSPEPMIGVDIGVPPPIRRIKADPAASSRLLIVLAVAVGAIIAVLLLAFLLSRASGGGSPAPGVTIPSVTAAASEATARPSAAATNGQVTVPSLIGVQSQAAQQEVRALHLKPSITTQSATQPKGTVIDQAPAGGSPARRGDTVFIVVSSGS